MFSYFKGSHGGCQTQGMSIWPYVHIPPIHLDAPYVQQVLIGYLSCIVIKYFSTLRGSCGGLSDLGDVHMSPYYLYAPCMFGCPHVWTPLNVWMLPVCLDATMFWTSPMFRCPRFGHPHVWMPPLCWTPPYILDAPYILTPTLCLDTSIHLGISTYKGGI